MGASNIVLMLSKWARAKGSGVSQAKSASAKAWSVTDKMKSLGSSPKEHISAGVLHREAARANTAAGRKDEAASHRHMADVHEAAAKGAASYEKDRAKDAFAASATKVANEATRTAMGNEYKDSSLKDHAAAAKAHDVASKAHAAVGNVAEAKEHQEAADAHRSLSDPRLGGYLRRDVMRQVGESADRPRDERGRFVAK